jgi:hypothetical protein
VAVARADDAIGGAGVCPGCKLLPHLLGPSSGGSFQISDVDIAEGFDAMVDAGAWVISNSWGPSTGTPSTWDVQPPAAAGSVKAAYQYAESTGGNGNVISRRRQPNTSRRQRHHDQRAELSATSG